MKPLSSLAEHDFITIEGSNIYFDMSADISANINEVYYNDLNSARLIYYYLIKGSKDNVLKTNCVYSLFSKLTITNKHLRFETESYIVNADFSENDNHVNETKIVDQNDLNRIEDRTIHALNENNDFGIELVYNQGSGMYDMIISAATCRNYSNTMYFEPKRGSYGVGNFIIRTKSGDFDLTGRYGFSAYAYLFSIRNNGSTIYLNAYNSGSARFTIDKSDPFNPVISEVIESSLEKLVLNNKVLTTDNEQEYYPIKDYHPSTKAYVDSTKFILDYSNLFDAFVKSIYRSDYGGYYDITLNPDELNVSYRDTYRIPGNYASFIRFGDTIIDVPAYSMTGNDSLGASALDCMNPKIDYISIRSESAGSNKIISIIAPTYKRNVFIDRDSLEIVANDYTFFGTSIQLAKTTNIDSMFTS